jgi:hypothetical protein
MRRAQWILSLLLGCGATIGLNGTATGTGIFDTPGTITYIDAAGNQRIYVFATGSNGHLEVNWWDGINWYWADQGLAPGGAAISSPAAITYVDPGDGNQRIYVFTTGSNGDLEVNWWDGFNWYWADQGLAPGGTRIQDPTPITYVDAAGNQRIYVFAAGLNGHLEVNWWDGFNWYWADQGLAPGGAAISSPAAITYVDPADGNQRIYVFTPGSNGDLEVNWWDGFNWYWADQGPAPSGTGMTDPAPITYVDAAGNQRIYVFVTGSNGHLEVNWWDGFSWYWADEGLAPGGTGTQDPSPITYVDAAGNRRIYVFAEGLNGHLEVHWWDGFYWYWADEGLAPGSTFIADPAAITYVDPGDGNQRIYVFAPGINGHLEVHWWDGFNWYWADQGLAP